MSIPKTGFVLRVIRERTEEKGSGSGKRYRTVGRYECYWNGSLISDPDMSGATVEPRGPGSNKKKGVNKSLRIEEGTYQLGTHVGTKYASINYKKSSRPRPGIYVFDTDKRKYILVHRGIGFKASIGCINLTGSIVDVNDNIGPNTSYARMDALISFMDAKLDDFTASAKKRAANAWLVVEGEP